jgi:nicotinamide-nucleotide amidase
MKTAILTVGTEILFGSITNTNSVYLSQQLQMIGYDVMYHYTVGDNTTRLEELIHEIFKDCDLILTTGGLGPTQDDLTKETVCKAMGDELVLWEDQLEILKAHFEKRGHKMTENNIKQAWFPKKAHIFDNPKGTAPGFMLEEGGKMIICMPGPPHEMTYMFENRVRPFLCARQDSVLFYKNVRTFGIGESALETELLDLINGQTDPTLATYAKPRETTLRVASKRGTLEEAKLAVSDMIEDVIDIVGDFVYSTDDEDLTFVVGKKLIANRLSLASAESITGGRFAGSITDVPGISACYRGGFVTYTDNTKKSMLDVSGETLDSFTCYSPETALEMVRGVKAKTGADICIAVTGLAGPDGGTEEHPVGQSYIGLIYPMGMPFRSGFKGGKQNRFTVQSEEGVHVREQRNGSIELVKEIHAFGRDRNSIREYTVLAMLSLINSLF